MNAVTRLNATRYAMVVSSLTSSPLDRMKQGIADDNVTFTVSTRPGIGAWEVLGV